LGLSFFALARIYYGQSRRWMANGMLHDLQSQPSGSRKLIVLALRLEGATAPERKRLQSDLDRGVAQSRCDAARIVDLVGDPGFVNSVFSDVMLVYWLIPQDSALDWQSDVDIIQRVVAQGRQQELLGGRLRIAQQARDITWSRVNGWTEAVFASILDVMRATAPATLPTFEKERTP
jgi:hypothetical protein